MNSHNNNDYVKHLDLGNGAQIGICEVQGKRPTQEDAVAHDAGENSLNFSKLSDEEKRIVMLATFLSFQMKVNSPHYQDAGSCACVATGWIDDKGVNISTSYVGDSVNYVVSLDKDMKLQYSIACNPELHNASNQKEVEAIQNGKDRARGKIVQHGGLRLHAGTHDLSTTRALGDVYGDPYGVSHHPETTPTMSLPHHGTEFMIVVCDGAMEHLSHGSDKHNNIANRFGDELGILVQNAFADNPNLNPAELAEIIQKNATGKNSEDNISVLVIPLSKIPVTAAVFDGHGGDRVSQFLGESFNQYFKHVLNMQPDERMQIISRFNLGFQERISAGIPSKPTEINAATMIHERQMRRLQSLDEHIAAVAAAEPAPVPRSLLLASLASAAVATSNPVVTPAVVAASTPAVTQQTEAERQDKILTNLHSALHSTLNSNSKKTSEPLQLILNELQSYIDSNKRNDQSQIDAVVKAITQIINFRRKSAPVIGKLFQHSTNTSLENINNVMINIKKPDAEKSIEAMIEQMSASPRKAFGRK